MEFCTNCGAAAREGAKFCTNCGAHLESGDSVSDAAPQTTPEATATHETVEYVPESGTPAEDAPDEQDLSSDDHAARWRTTEDASGDTGADPEIAPVSDTSAAAETPSPETDEPAAPYIESWPSAGDPEGDPVAEDAPISANAETDGTNWPPPPEAIAAMPADEDDGPSSWESWAPTPDPEPAVSSGTRDVTGADDEALREIRGLVDTLQRRLGQLASPTPVTSRGVDADELADQMNGWVRDAPSSADLLDVVRGARANPRDLDAVTRLADRASELERLVEHYGTICTDAERWVARLRNHDGWQDA